MISKHNQKLKDARVKRAMRCKLLAKTMRLDEVAKLEGCSKQRVHQLIKSLDK